MSAHVYAGSIAYVLIVWVTGYAVLYALGIARGVGAVKLAGLAYLTGWGVLGILLSYALMGGISLRVETALVVTALVVVVCAAVGGFVSPVRSRSSPGSRGGSLGRVAFAVGAVVILAAAVSAVVIAVESTWTPDEDAIDLWLPHAQAIYYGHQLWWHTAVFHPEYPPLTSAMDALVFTLVGGFHPSLLPLLRCLLGLSFVGAVLALLDRFAPRWLSFPSVALLMVAPEFFDRLDSLLPDQTLAYFVTVAAVSCVLWLLERRAAWLVLAVILSATATLTKLEGATYALLLTLIVVAGAAVRRNRKLALTALALALGAVAIEPWRLTLGSHGLPTSSTDYHVTDLFHPEYLAHRVHRIPYSAQHVLDVMFSPGRWLVILPLALLVVVAASRRAPLVAAGSATWLVLAFAGLVVVYWIGEFGMLLRDEVLFTAHRVSGTIVIVAAAMIPVVLALALRSPPRQASSD